jgi:hypothetical protein
VKRRCSKSETATPNRQLQSIRGLRRMEHLLLAGALGQGSGCTTGSVPSRQPEVVSASSPERGGGSGSLFHVKRSRSIVPPSTSAES